MKLIICDIDNTLVEKHQPLSKLAKDTVFELKKQGWLFGLASGRTVPQLKQLAEQWGIGYDVLIGLNGCELYDGLDDYYKMYYYLEPECVKEALEIMAPFDTVPCGSRGKLWISLNKGVSFEESRRYLKNGGSDYVLVDNIEEFYKDYMDKICFRVSADIMPEVEAHAAKFKSEYFKTIKTETTMFEFCSIHASKGNILEIFCQRHSIPLENVWAFGDMDNDNDMLIKAGHGVCLLNGAEGTKAVADYITEKPVNEDGWVHFVKENIL